MNSAHSLPSPSKDVTQTRLLVFAVLTLLLYSLVLSLSPAVRLHTWAVTPRWQHWIGFGVWLAGTLVAHQITRRRLPEHDPYLLPAVALLTGLGLLTIWRLDFTFGLRQTIWLAICFLALGLGVVYPGFVNLLRRYKYLLLVSGLFLTALTFALGVYPGGEGPRLWLGCCGVYLQPSEPLKLLLLVYLAAYLADRMPVVFNLGELLAPTLVMVGAAVALLVAQRDLGTTTLIIVLYGLTVYLASGQTRILLASGALILVMGLVGYRLFDVIRLRIDAWLNPWLDPSGRSFQIVQSIIAFASGGILGTGPGLGSPGLVPVAHSDFIAASLAEETGLLGIAAVLCLYALIIVRGMIIALRANNNYRRILAAGICVYFAAQAVLIMGGNIRLLPLTGVTLPFVSYGGSSLLTAFIAFTILLLISSNGEEEPAPLNNPQPYLITGSLLLLALFSLAIVAGWWGFGQAEDLQARADNPRRIINDRYVRRGPLFDRQNRPLVLTEGEPGSFTRTVTYAPLGNVIGYNHPVFGQSGLEAGLDSYLRGLQGNPTLQVWSTQLLYNQPPPGLAIRLSLDLDIQQVADRAFGEQTGAGVLLNARTGEVLMMVSHPSFDPNRLDDQWNGLLQDPSAPLVNRATQGQYPLGGAIAPFALARVLDQGNLPPQLTRLDFHLDGQTLACALTPRDPAAWGEALQKGCPGAIVSMSRALSSAQFVDLQRQLGFYATPDLPLEQAVPTEPVSASSPARAALGRTALRVTPMQMSLAAAALTNAGQKPGPLLAMAVRTPNQGWVVFPAEGQAVALTSGSAQEAVDLLSISDLPIWESVSSVESGEGQVHWYLAGTLPQWSGSPLSLALVLETGSAAEAQEIGRDILASALTPQP